MTEAGTSKLWGDPGLHNKPLGGGASELYASGPACEEEKKGIVLDIILEVLTSK